MALKALIFLSTGSSAASFVVLPATSLHAPSVPIAADVSPDGLRATAPARTSSIHGALFMMGAAIGASVASHRSGVRKALSCGQDCHSQNSRRSGSRVGLRAVYGTPRKVQIIPSVLPADFGKLGEECKRLEDAGVDRIQFDVMDGNFVPNLTFGPDVIAYMKKYTSVLFETQLMVAQPCLDAMLPTFVEATNQPGKPGVTIVHVEAATHLHRNLGQIRAGGGSPSVALNPHTPAEMIENVLDLVDHVLVMTVNPGFGGQAYIPTMLNKIRKIRKWIVDRGLDVDIEVDGGIKANKTIAECADAGANCFIAGSGLFAYDDLSKGVTELRSLAEAGQKGEMPKE